MITTWRGQPITELTREELIEALEEVGDLYRQSLESHDQHIRVLDMLRSRG